MRIIYAYGAWNLFTTPHCHPGRSESLLCHPERSRGICGFVRVKNFHFAWNSSPSGISLHDNYAIIDGGVFLNVVSLHASNKVCACLLFRSLAGGHRCIFAGSTAVPKQPVFRKRGFPLFPRRTHSLPKGNFPRLPRFSRTILLQPVPGSGRR